MGRHGSNSASAFFLSQISHFHNSWNHAITLHSHHHCLCWDLPHFLITAFTRLLRHLTTTSLCPIHPLLYYTRVIFLKPTSHHFTTLFKTFLMVLLPPEVVLKPGWKADLESTKINWKAGGNFTSFPNIAQGFPVGSVVKNPPASQKTWVRSLGCKDLLGEEMATHSNILAWEISWTEEPGEL